MTLITHQDFNDVGGLSMDNEIKVLLDEAEGMMDKRYVEGSHKVGRRVNPNHFNFLRAVRLSNNTRIRLLSLIVRGRNNGV